MVGQAKAGRRNRTRASDERIYREIFDAIFDHRLPPGTALPEDTLGTAFGVSRTVIRKALIRLAHERLIDLRRNRGAVVARPSVEEARQLFDARRVIEPALARAVVNRIDAQAIERLRASVASEREAFATGERRTLIRLTGEFHAKLAALAGNEVLADMLRELISRTSLVIALYEQPGVCPCSLTEHDELVDLLARRDAEGVVASMRRHLDHCEAQLDLAGNGSSVNLLTLFAHVRAPEYHAS